MLAIAADEGGQLNRLLQTGQDKVMFNVKRVARQILDNCEISDAQHAGLYSTCGLALRLRDLYKWEHRLNPWEEKDSSEILDWIGEKETLWEKLADAKHTPITIGGKDYDLFDTHGINANLEPDGIFYGAGYAFSLKPTFFLAEIDAKSRNETFGVMARSTIGAGDRVSRHRGRLGGRIYTGAVVVA